MTAPTNHTAPNRPTSPASRRHRWSGIAALGAGLLLTVALGGCSTDQAQPQPADPTTEATMINDRVSFADGVLHLGDTTLDFPGYKPSTFFELPAWPNRSSVVIERAENRPEHVVVSAAQIDNATDLGRDADAIMSEPEIAMFGPTTPLITEDAIPRPGGECRYRISQGPFAASHDPESTTAAGVIVMTVGDLPVIAVVVDGYYLDDVRKHTVEIAEALCDATPAGATDTPTTGEQP